MDPLLATLALILLALLGARVTFSTERVSPGPRLLFRTGTHFLFIGWLLGPGRLDLLNQDAVEQLYPLMALGLGWVGLLFGAQLDRNSLRQFSWGYHFLALGQALLTFLLFLGAGWVTLGLTGYGGDEVAMLMVMVGAATACVTTPAGIAMVSSNFLVRGDVVRLLFFIASVDALVGIAALQVTYSFYHPAQLLIGFGTAPAPAWIAVGLGLGVVCAIIFLWLTRARASREELVLYLLGISALGSGAALQLHVSPLFVCVTMGAVVANMMPDPQRVFQALHKWEKPIYVVLLMLAGALLRVPTWWVLPLAILYAVVRGVSKLAASAILVPVAPLHFRPPRRLGLGLIPQGGISLAMAISVVLTYSGLTLEAGASAVDVLFGVIVLGVVLSELVGPSFTTTLLRRAGEISPRVEEALSEGDEQRAEAEAIRHTPSNHRRS